MAGGGGNYPDAEQSRAYARQVIVEAGASDIAALQQMDWASLNAAANRAAAAINGPGAPAGGPPAPGAPRVGSTPTLDGRLIDVRSFTEVAPEVSRDVPVIIGCNSEEGMRWSQNPTEDEWLAQLTEQLGAAKAGALVAAMKAAHPEKAIRTLSYGVGGLQFRNRAQDMVRLKYEQQGAPVYQYLFQWQSPMLDGVAGAWHTAELAFCFDNTQRCEQGTGDTPEARALATRMAGASAPGRRSHGRETRASLTSSGRRAIRRGARPWCSTTSAAWWTILRAKCGAYF
jgi:para-nitrobenzyl esterase